MNIIAVDDERPALRVLESAIRAAAPEAALACFSTAAQAIAHAADAPPDVAFLDIDLAGMDGLTLAGQLKEICPQTNIVFVTGHAQYAVDAFSLAASGYILKPVEKAAIEKALGELRHPVREACPAHIRVQCFGSFGVFVDGQPLLFSRAKPKELLAYLVHKNGTAATPAEIAAVLWEDKAGGKSLQSQARKAITQLQQALQQAGIGDIIRKGWNSIAVDVSKITCDYHAFLKGDASAVNAYAGEYLNDYSWAEFTVGQIDSKVKGWGK